MRLRPSWPSRFSNYVWHASHPLDDERSGRGCRRVGYHRPGKPEQFRYVLDSLFSLPLKCVLVLPRFTPGRVLVFLRSMFGFYHVATHVSRATPRTTPRPRSHLICLSYLNTHHLLPKLMPRLVSVLPVPSPAEATPRGIKRARTPDRSGNGHTEGDQDDGTCAMRR